MLDRDLSEDNYGGEFEMSVSDGSKAYAHVWVMQHGDSWAVAEILVIIPASDNKFRWVITTEWYEGATGLHNFLKEHCECILGDIPGDSRTQLSVTEVSRTHYPPRPRKEFARAIRIMLESQ